MLIATLTWASSSFNKQCAQVDCGAGRTQVRQMVRLPSSGVEVEHRIHILGLYEGLNNISHHPHTRLQSLSLRFLHIRSSHVILHLMNSTETFSTEYLLIPNEMGTHLEVEMVELIKNITN